MKNDALGNNIFVCSLKYASC
uniref:Uncharacterized protein n=1 Tax=Arundo donax TaxID=35708 RepID=A0A0A8ZMF0_ARUDO